MTTQGGYPQIGGQRVVVPNLGGPPPAALGTIAFRVTLGDPGQLTSYTTTEDSWTTVLTESVTVLGAASAIMIFASWDGIKTNAPVCLLRARLRIDGSVVAEGVAVSLAPDEMASSIIQAVVPEAAGAYTVDLQMFVEAPDGDFVIDPATGGVPGVDGRQASLLAREVPT